MKFVFEMKKEEAYKRILDVVQASGVKYEASSKEEKNRALYIGLFHDGHLFNLIRIQDDFIHMKYTSRRRSGSRSFLSVDQAIEFLNHAFFRDKFFLHTASDVPPKASIFKKAAESQAYNEGKEAKVNGKKITENPYPVHCPAVPNSPHSAWKRGWNESVDPKGKKSLRDSSVDFPRATLSLNVWDLNGDTYTLKPAVKKQIMDLMDKYEGYPKFFVDETVKLSQLIDGANIVGSIGTNTYSDNADVDVHMKPNEEAVKTLAKGTPAELTKDIMDFFKKYRLGHKEEGFVATHPIEFYLQFDSQQDLLSDSVYNIDDDMWVIGPLLRDPAYNPYEVYADVVASVANVVKDADVMIGQLRRDVMDYEALKAALGTIPEEGKKALLIGLQNKVAHIENDVNKLLAQRKEWVLARKEASRPLTMDQAKKDIMLVRKWQEKNALFKLLDKYMYLQLTTELEKMMDDKKLTPDEIAKIGGMVEKEEDYVNFGDVARKDLGMQCQYASRYHGGVHGSPNLTQGLRVTGTPSDYHSMKIHKDDVAEFVKRVKKYRVDAGIEEEDSPWFAPAGFDKGKEPMKMIDPPKSELDLLALPETERTWKMIRDALDPDGSKHDLRLKCVKCGNEETCRCSKPKREFLGVCNDCAGKVQESPKAINVGDSVIYTGEMDPEVDLAGERFIKDGEPQMGDTDKEHIGKVGVVKEIPETDVYLVDFGNGLVGALHVSEIKLSNKVSVVREALDFSKMSEPDLDFCAKHGLGPKYVPKEPKKHKCPKCEGENAYFKEIHPDTDMNDVVLFCPDCKFLDESETAGGTRLSSAYQMGFKGLPYPPHLGGKDSKAKQMYDKGKKDREDKLGQVKKVLQEACKGYVFEDKNLTSLVDGEVDLDKLL